MITHLKIENFQSVSDLTLKLGKLTVITGPSNSGKSAVVRAIRHALTNPRGSGVVQVGAKQAGVSLAKDGADSFTWVKPTKGGASYRVPGAVYTVTGSGPDSLPEQARTIIDIDPEIQISDQFEGPFLLTRTASQAAAVLGSLSRADRILQAVKHANGKGREAEGKAKTLTEQQEAAQERLRALDWYPPVHARIAELAPQADALYQLNQRRSSLRLRLDNAHYTASHARALRDRIAAAEALKQPLAEQHQKLVDTAQGYDRVSALRARLRSSYEAATAAAASVNAATTHLKAATERLAALITELPNSACPTCGQTITEDAAHFIVGVHQ